MVMESVIKLVVVRLLVKGFNNALTNLALRVDISTNDGRGDLGGIRRSNNGDNISEMFRKTNILVIDLLFTSNQNHVNSFGFIVKVQLNLNLVFTMRSFILSHVRNKGTLDNKIQVSNILSDIVGHGSMSDFKLYLIQSSFKIILLISISLLLLMSLDQFSLDLLDLLLSLLVLLLLKLVLLLLLLLLSLLVLLLLVLLLLLLELLFRFQDFSKLANLSGVLFTLTGHIRGFA